MPWWRKEDLPAHEPTSSPVNEEDRTTSERTKAGGARVRTVIEREAACGAPDKAAEVSMSRVAAALGRLGIRHLTDEDGNLLAMWERHVVLFALEGPDTDILVMRARAYTALPPDWADLAYAAINEWNHTRRFLKSYVGDETESGRLSLYAEMQLPLTPGVHDALLDELVDCAAAVSGSWASWLYDEGALL